MARHLCNWTGDWESTPWASARAIWKRETPEEERLDCSTWEEAACEEGRFLRVVWCEICQLASDLAPRVPHLSARDLSSCPVPVDPSSPPRAVPR